jgi:hypothetical protein
MASVFNVAFWNVPVCLYLFALSLMQQGDRSSAGLVLGCYTWELLGFQAWDK